MSDEDEIRTQALLLEIHNSLRELIAVNKGLDENGEPIVGAMQVQVQVPQGGFEGRRRQVPPIVKEAKPGERPPERPPAGKPIHLDLIQHILEQNETFRQILVRLTEVVKSIQIAPRLENKYINTPLRLIQAATDNPPAGDNLDPTKITRILLEATWTASTAYILDNIVRPTSANSTGYLYECTTAGTSGLATAEPTWPTTVGNTVTDGPNLVWTCRSAAGYQVEGIYTQLQRISPKLTVINDGTSTVYAITTPDGSNWSQESPILVGEARTLFNVWELRLRSPSAGNLNSGIGGIYRVTEYDLQLTYSNVKPAASFTARYIQLNVLPTGTQLPDITIPYGFSLVVRALVANPTLIYMANSEANLSLPANRITLNAGDIVNLTISNANVIWLGSPGAVNNFVDILVEQNLRTELLTN